MQINDAQSGRIVRLKEGYRAFVPHPLPPRISWDNTLVSALSRADYVLGKLAREGSKLPNPHLLMRPFVTREAVLSSKIEGTQATIGEVLAHNIGILVNENTDDLKEVQNYITALDLGLERMQQIPLSLRLIKEMHKALMQGVRGAYATPGDFRKSQNWIGPPGCTINTAKFVPPPVDYLQECLGQLEQFLHYRQLPSLVHIALCHYQFEAIHPFLDGNGRLGRLLITLLLIDQKRLPGPLLYLSAFFEATRETYYTHLFNVSQSGYWNAWLIYFLNGVAVQSEDVLSRAERINTLIDAWKLSLAMQQSRGLLSIIEQFAINPYLTIKTISEDLKIPYSTVDRGVKKLLKANIVKQTGTHRRDKVYCATEILAILEEPAKIYPSSET